MGVHGTETCPIQHIQQGMNIVSKHCPIGKGLWNNKPSEPIGEFWVQCGIVDELPTLAFQQHIKKHIDNTTDWVFRPENPGYRCLLGPYSTFRDANEIRNKIRQEAVTSDAFVRQITANRGKAASATASSSKTASTASVQRNKAARKLDPVLGLWTPKPKGNDARYTTHQRDWWRATYSDAKKACQQSGKRLVAESSLRRASERKGAQTQLPATIPYWLSNGNVYDIKLDMAFVAISDTLTLNVLCE